MIHPTAIIHPTAEIASTAEIGPYTIIEEHVVIGEGTTIASHVVIRRNTVIGKNCRIFQFASIGEVPQDLKYSGQETRVVMGDGNVIREYVTLHRASVHGDGKTELGDANFLMAYCHVAHDCKIGNHVIMANGATLGGHIEIEDYAILGGLSAAHQFVRIGTHCIISGLTGIPKDIPPYTMAAGERARLYGLNLTGLKRHHFPEQTLRSLKKAYRLLFRSKLPLTKAVENVLNDGISSVPEVAHLIDFIKRSERGICR
ncbi:MAG: acyl-ACP--UDP-N-acetylglucosamine O-acyltransferase [Deltaproteobacteria bacterium]|nr:acyl-ACP--UDP-N-acetylglucosamine O-acyltransferase [Deltaproteobacteria bacterium]MBW2120972.1 acyl-ACP--UDP-N-acetylglucosamine O-acyltransferase [Deltaproteobacteria bacterium]